MQPDVSDEQHTPPDVEEPEISPLAELRRGKRKYLLPSAFQVIYTHTHTHKFVMNNHGSEIFSMLRSRVQKLAPPPPHPRRKCGAFHLRSLLQTVASRINVSIASFLRCSTALGIMDTMETLTHSRARWTGDLKPHHRFDGNRTRLEFGAAAVEMFRTEP